MGVEILKENGEHVSVLEDIDGVVSGAGEAIAGVTPDGDGLIVDLKGELLAELPPCLSPLALSTDASAVVVTKTDCGVESGSGFNGVLDVATGTALVTAEGGIGWAGFSLPTAFDGREYVAFTVDDPSSSGNADLASWVEVWSIDPVELVGVIDDDDAGYVFIRPRFSLDGRLLGIGTNGATAMVVDVEKMVKAASADEYIVFNREVHSGNTPWAIPTSDGRLATGSFDGFYRLWDIASGEKLFEIEVGVGLPNRGSGFSSDESTLFYKRSANAIGLLPTDVDEMISLARESVTRTLTDDECREYLHTDGC